MVAFWKVIESGVKTDLNLVIVCSLVDNDPKLLNVQDMFWKLKTMYIKQLLSPHTQATIIFHIKSSQGKISINHKCPRSEIQAILYSPRNFTYGSN